MGQPMKLEAADIDGLRPLIRAVIVETLAELKPDTNGHGLQVFTEAEAAKVLKMRQHQLRDERRRGRVRYSRGPRNSIRYTRENLNEYLSDRAG